MDTPINSAVPLKRDLSVSNVRSYSFRALNRTGHNARYGHFVGRHLANRSGSVSILTS